MKLSNWLKLYRLTTVERCEDLHLLGIVVLCFGLNLVRDVGADTINPNFLIRAKFAISARTVWCSYWLISFKGKALGKSIIYCCLNCGNRNLVAYFDPRRHGLPQFITICSRYRPARVIVWNRSAIVVHVNWLRNYSFEGKRENGEQSSDRREMPVNCTLEWCSQ